MCSCNQAVARRRASPAAAPRTYFRVYDGDEEISGRFRKENYAEIKRIGLCVEAGMTTETCTYEVRVEVPVDVPA